MVTIWSNQAKAQLHKANLYILLDSPQNAELFRDDQNARKHPADKFKKDNDGTCRAFEKLQCKFLFE